MYTHPKRYRHHHKEFLSLTHCVSNKSHPKTNRVSINVPRFLQPNEDRSYLGLVLLYPLDLYESFIIEFHSIMSLFIFSSITLP